MSEAAREADLLREGCRELGIELAAAQHDRLLAYLDLLYIWNRSAGLTTIARADGVRLHLLDSLAAVGAVPAGPCLDLGAGGGLPGLVLAIAKPDIPFVLVESNRRKCSFLLEAVRAGGLPNVEVEQSDYERFEMTRPFPVVISRAFRPPAEFLAIARRFVAPAGRIVLLLADPADDELTRLAADSGLRLLGCDRLRLPQAEEPRAIVTFEA